MRNIPATSGNEPAVAVCTKQLNLLLLLRKEREENLGLQIANAFHRLERAGKKKEEGIRDEK